jgi:hypothetical protein
LHLEEDFQLSKFLKSKGLIVKRAVWNDLQIDLKQIADDGLPVIKSVFLEKGIVPDLAELLDKSGCKKMIIKPCVSASAKNTMLLTFDNYYQGLLQLID